jgi:HEAT repeat protein
MSEGQPAVRDPGAEPPTELTALRRRTDDLLTEVLRSSEPSEVRGEAALALAALGRRSAEVVELLATTLQESEEPLRRMAVLALGKTRDPKAAEPLLDVLEHSPELWEEASAALGELRDAGAIDRLRTMIQSAEDSRTRRGAIRALAALSLGPGRFRSREAAAGGDAPVSYPPL